MRSTTFYLIEYFPREEAVVYMKIFFIRKFAWKISFSSFLVYRQTIVLDDIVIYKAGTSQTGERWLFRHNRIWSFRVNAIHTSEGRFRSFHVGGKRKNTNTPFSFSISPKTGYFWHRLVRDNYLERSWPDRRIDFYIIRDAPTYALYSQSIHVRGKPFPCGKLVCVCVCVYTAPCLYTKKKKKIEKWTSAREKP